MDREKVIKGLEELSSFLFQAYSKVQAEEVNLFYERFLAVDNAIALLKEQEAVEPVTESSVYDPDTWFFVCGSCKKGVIDRGDKFCRWCGQKVKWNEP